MKTILAIIITALLSIAGTYGVCTLNADPSFPVYSLKISPPLGPEPIPSPFALNIRGERWTIWSGAVVPDFEKELKDRGAMGMTYCDKKIIVYDPQETQDLRNTLWHEIFHAGACDRGGSVYWNSKSDEDNEHPGIQNLADFMEDFSRTNPTFIRWETE